MILIKIKRLWNMIKILFFSLFLIVSLFFARKVDILNLKIEELNDEIVEQEKKYKNVEKETKKIVEDFNKLNELVENETN